MVKIKRNRVILRGCYRDPTVGHTFVHDSTLLSSEILITVRLAVLELETFVTSTGTFERQVQFGAITASRKITGLMSRVQF